MKIVRFTQNTQKMRLCRKVLRTNCAWPAKSLTWHQTSGSLTRLRHFCSPDSGHHRQEYSMFRNCVFLFFLFIFFIFRKSCLVYSVIPFREKPVQSQKNALQRFRQLFLYKCFHGWKFYSFFFSRIVLNDVRKRNPL